MYVYPLFSTLNFLILFVYIKYDNNDILVNYHVYNKEINNNYSESVIDTNLEYMGDDHIYPINIISNYIKKNIVLDKKTYKQYFEMKQKIQHNDSSISGIVIPVEYLISNNKFYNYDSELLRIFRRDFHELLTRLQIFISKLSDLLIIYSNDKLHIICTNYKNSIFIIENNNNKDKISYDDKDKIIFDNDKKFIYNGDKFRFAICCGIQQCLDLQNSIYIDGKYIYFLDNPFIFNLNEVLEVFNDKYNNIIEQTLKTNVKNEFINKYSNDFTNINTLPLLKTKLLLVYAYYFSNIYLVNYINTYSDKHVERYIENKECNMLYKYFQSKKTHFNDKEFNNYEFFKECIEFLFNMEPTSSLSMYNFVSHLSKNIQLNNKINKEKELNDVVNNHSIKDSLYLHPQIDISIIPYEGKHIYIRHYLLLNILSKSCYSKPYRRFFIKHIIDNKQINFNNIEDEYEILFKFETIAKEQHKYSDMYRYFLTNITNISQNIITDLVNTNIDFNKNNIIKKTIDFRIKNNNEQEKLMAYLLEYQFNKKCNTYTHVIFTKDNNSIYDDYSGSDIKFNKDYSDSENYNYDDNSNKNTLHQIIELKIKIKLFEIFDINNYLNSNLYIGIKDNIINIINIITNNFTNKNNTFNSCINNIDKVIKDNKVINGGVFNENEIKNMNDVIIKNLYNNNIKDVSKENLRELIQGSVRDFNNYEESNKIDIKQDTINFNKLYDIIDNMRNKLDKEQNTLRNDIFYKTGYTVLQYLYIFLNNIYYIDPVDYINYKDYLDKQDKNNKNNENILKQYNRRLPEILGMCKYYLKLCIIYEVCLNFLSKSNEFYQSNKIDQIDQIDQIDKYNQL